MDDAKTELCECIDSSRQILNLIDSTLEIDVKMIRVCESMETQYQGHFESSIRIFQEHVNSLTAGKQQILQYVTFIEQICDDNDAGSGLETPERLDSYDTRELGQTYPPSPPRKDAAADAADVQSTENLVGKDSFTRDQTYGGKPSPLNETLMTTGMFYLPLPIASGVDALDEIITICNDMIYGDKELRKDKVAILPNRLKHISKDVLKENPEKYDDARAVLALLGVSSRIVPIEVGDLMKYIHANMAKLRNKYKSLHMAWNVMRQRVENYRAMPVYNEIVRELLVLARRERNCDKIPTVLKTENPFLYTEMCDPETYNKNKEIDKFKEEFGKLSVVNEHSSITDVANRIAFLQNFILNIPESDFKKSVENVIDSLKLTAQDHKKVVQELTNVVTWFVDNIKTETNQLNATTRSHFGGIVKTAVDVGVKHLIDSLRDALAPIIPEMIDKLYVKLEDMSATCVDSTCWEFVSEYRLALTDFNKMLTMCGGQSVNMANLDDAIAEFEKTANSDDDNEARGLIRAGVLNKKITEQNLAKVSGIWVFYKLLIRLGTIIRSEFRDALVNRVMYEGSDKFFSMVEIFKSKKTVIFNNTNIWRNEVENLRETIYSFATHQRLVSDANERALKSANESEVWRTEMERWKSNYETFSASLFMNIKDDDAKILVRNLCQKGTNLTPLAITQIISAKNSLIPNEIATHVKNTITERVRSFIDADSVTDDNAAVYLDIYGDLLTPAAKKACELKALSHHVIAVQDNVVDPVKKALSTIDRNNVGDFFDEYESRYIAITRNPVIHKLMSIDLSYNGVNKDLRDDLKQLHQNIINLSSIVKATFVPVGDNDDDYLVDIDHAIDTQIVRRIIAGETGRWVRATKLISKLRKILKDNRIDDIDEYVNREINNVNTEYIAYCLLKVNAMQTHLALFGQLPTQLDADLKLKTAMDNLLKNQSSKNVLTYVYFRCDKSTDAPLLTMQDCNNRYHFTFDKAIKRIHMEYTVDDVQHYDRNGNELDQPTNQKKLRYMYGPFTSIVRPSETVDLKPFMDVLLEQNKTLFIMGYGSSGAGKTSTLINRKGTPGIAMILCNELGEKYNYTTVSMTCLEFYADLQNKEAPPKTIKSTSLGFKYKYNRFFALIGDHEHKNNHPHRTGSPSIRFNDGTDIGKVAIHMIDTDRLVKATTNNPNSSRSHALLVIKLKNAESKTLNLVIGDFAGVENEFDCDDSVTKTMFANVRRDNDNERAFYSEEFYKGQFDVVDGVGTSDATNCAEKMQRRWDHDMWDDSTMPIVVTRNANTMNKAYQLHLDKKDIMSSFFLFREEETWETDLANHLLENQAGAQSRDGYEREIKLLDAREDTPLLGDDGYLNRKIITPVDKDGKPQYFDSSMADYKIPRKSKGDNTGVFEYKKHHYCRGIPELADPHHDYHFIDPIKYKDLCDFIKKGSVNKDNEWFAARSRIRADSGIGVKAGDVTDDAFKKAGCIEHWGAHYDEKTYDMKNKECKLDFVKHIMDKYKSPVKLLGISEDQLMNANNVVEYLDEKIATRRAHLESILSEIDKNEKKNSKYVKIITNHEWSRLNQHDKESAKNWILDKLGWFAPAIGARFTETLDALLTLLNGEEYREFYEDCIRMIQTVKDAKEDRDCRLKFAPIACKNRVIEGKYINRELSSMRDILTHIISRNMEQNPTIMTSPLYLNECVESYCPIKSASCWETQAVNTKDSAIIKQLADMDIRVEDIVPCVFCVFNNSKNVNDPPKTPYYPIDKLKAYVARGQAASDDQALDAAISELKESLVVYENYPSTADINAELTYAKMNFGLTKKLMQFVDNLNAITPVGTLEFTDRMSKFGMVINTCETNDQALLNSTSTPIVNPRGD